MKAPNLKKIILSSIVWLVSSILLYAGDINVTLNVLPPYTPYVSDYFSLQNKTIVTFTNLNRINYQIKIVGKIEGDNGVVISTSPDYSPPNPINVPAFGSVTIFGSDLEKYFDINTVEISGIRKQELLAGGGLPEGNYQLCVQAFDYNTNLPLSDEAPTGCSAPFTIQQIEPPFIITPTCDDNITALTPQNVVFTWTTPSRINANTKYLLKIAELPNTLRNPGDALNNLTTPPFFEKTLTTNSYIYGMSDPNLIVGKKYAFSVTVFETLSGRIGEVFQNNIAFKNNGQSEPCVFTYGEAQEIQPTIIEEVLNVNTPIKTGSIKFTPQTIFTPIPLSHIKGKMVYAFYKTEETDGLDVSKMSMSDISENVTSIAGQNVGNDPNFFLELGSSIQNAGGSKPSGTPNLAQTFGEGSFSLSDLNFEDISLTEKSNSPQDMWAEAQKELQANAGNKRYPLSNQQIEAHLWLKDDVVKSFQQKININPSLKLPPNDIFLGTSTTDQEGNFDIQYNGGELIWGLYNVEITLKNDAQFYLPPIPIPLIGEEIGTYDLGEILTLANTFRLKTKVIGVGGKELKNAKISILRSENFYGSKKHLNPEGDRQGQEEKVTNTSNKKNNNKGISPNFVISDNVYAGLEGTSKAVNFEIAATMNEGETQKRLFQAYDNSEFYMVKIEADDHYSITVPLLFIVGQTLNLSGSSSSTDIKNNILNVSATYHLQPEKSKLVGRVVDKDKEVPLPNMEVQLYCKKNKELLFSTKTDNEGRFNLLNITPNTNPYYIRVNGDIIKNFEVNDPIYIETDGIKITKDPIYVKAQLLPIIGVVADMNSVPLNNAELKWKTGGKSFYTNDFGIYTGYNVVGKHTLIVKKPGYKSKEIEVELKFPETSKNSTPSNLNIGQLSAQSLLSQMGNNLVTSTNGTDFTIYPSNLSLQKGQNKNSTAPIDINAISELMPSFKNIFEENNQVDVPLLTLDTIKLSGYIVKVLVKDDDTKIGINNASIVSNDEEQTFYTNNNGIAILNNLGEGSTTISIHGPTNINYIPQVIAVSINPSDDTTLINISLKGGAQLSGKVTSASLAVPNAEVFVEGKNYIKAKTDNNGKYTLYIPEGEYTIVASKSGLLADKKTLVFEKKNYNQDFDLKDPGFNASKILGFDMVLYESKNSTLPNEFVISGAITNIPSNTLFTISKSKKLEFYNITVKKEGNIIVPKEGSLKLADAELSFKLWDYLQLKVQNAGGLLVKPLNSDNTNGVIGGDLLLDIDATFGSGYGLSWPKGKYNLTDESGNAFYNIFYSQNPSSPITSFKLKAPNTNWNIFGISLKPDFLNTIVSKDGISLGGAVEIKDIPGISNVTLQLQTLKIGTNGDIKEVKFNLSPTPKIQFMSWSMMLSNININQYGLKLAGEMNIPIPGSSNALFKFSDVNLNKSGLNSGNYSLVGVIDIFGVAKFTGKASNPLTFSKVPGSNDYRINGGGEIGLTSLINNKLVINNFLIATNGEFGVSCEPNFNVNFADVAKLKIKKIDLYPTKKEFAIDGGFRLDIPGIGADAGGYVHYKPDKVWVDKLNIGASMGGIGSFSAAVDFSDNGFSGSGDIAIVGMSGLGMGFSYYSQNSGKIIKANITTGITASIGVLTFDKIGGGFLYNSIESKYGVNLTGRMSLAPGTAAVLALDNIDIGVIAEPGGPVFYGVATPKVISMDVGIAQFKLDVPNKQIFVNTELKKSMQIFPGVGFDAAGGFMLAASAKSGDEYWLTGIYTRMNMLGIFNQNLNITGAYNLYRASHPEFNDYTSFIPEEYLNGGRINGFNAKFNSLQGRLSDNPYCKDAMEIANLCAYAYADMSMNMYSNFSTGKIGLGIKQEWGAGGNASFFGIGLAGAKIAVGFNLNGGYGSGNWFINGTGSASASAYIGCTSSDCGNGVSWGCCVDPCPVYDCEICPCPCGAKICLNPSVTASYSTADGKFNVDLNW
jgi:TANFOR domain-containing protein